MRVLLDATPMLGTRTGVGAYTSSLLAALARRPEVDTGALTLGVTTFSARARRVTDLPPQIRQVGAPLPARLLRSFWLRSSFPPLELIAGRCDVFHGTNFVSPPTVRAATVVTIHDLTYEHLRETVTTDVLAYRELVAQSLRRGAHVLTPTETVAEQVRDFYGLSPERVRATHLGVDPAWSSAPMLTTSIRARLGLPERYLLFVGSLDPRKNLPTLISAHAAAQRADHDVPPLVLAGPAGRTQGADLPGVIRTGWLDGNELRSVVATSAGLILPSLDEGFGLPLVEALACGRPVLASDLPVLREVAGTQAEFADPTIEGLLDGVHRLVAAPDDEQARASRRTWASRFTWDATAEGTLAAYRAAGA